MKKVRFEEIDARVPAAPGFYEIHTDNGIWLKCGIAQNLRRRLKQHWASRQSALRLRPDGSWAMPADVLSKSSILTKHLYYDESLAPEFDLESEAARVTFLTTCCYIRYCQTGTRAEARALEIIREREGGLRYSGRVMIRRKQRVLERI